MQAEPTRAILVIATVVGLGLAALGGCGGDDDPATRPEASAPVGGPHTETLPDGCRPRQTAAIMTRFFAAVDEGDREVGLGYVVAPPDLIGFTVKRPGSGRTRGWFEQEPADVYREVASAIGNSTPRLLAAATGPVGPFEGDTRGHGPSGDTVGVEIVFRLGSRSLSGKTGIDCTSGGIYIGSTHLERGLRRQQHCGRYIRFGMRKPAVCEI